MRKRKQSVKLLDYYQESASDQIVPQPAILRSLGWNGMHLELHQQPTFATNEHQHTMHVLVCGLIDSSNKNAPGGDRLMANALGRDAILVILRSFQQGLLIPVVGMFSLNLWFWRSSQPFYNKLDRIGSTLTRLNCFPSL